LNTSRAKSDKNDVNRQRKAASSKQSKTTPHKTQSRLGSSNRISSARKQEVRKESTAMDDDIEDEDDIDDDVGTMGDGKKDSKIHRKPAMRISTNNPVMV